MKHHKGGHTLRQFGIGNNLNYILLPTAIACRAGYCAVGETLNALFARPDRKLHEAKAFGRNRIGISTGIKMHVLTGLRENVAFRHLTCPCGRFQLASGLNVVNPDAIGDLRRRIDRLRVVIRALMHAPGLTPVAIALPFSRLLMRFSDQRLMREIFVPSMLRLAMSPCWSKMKA